MDLVFRVESCTTRQRVWYESGKTTDIRYSRSNLSNCSWGYCYITMQDYSTRWVTYVHLISYFNLKTLVTLQGKQTKIHSNCKFPFQEVTYWRGNAILQFWPPAPSKFLRIPDYEFYLRQQSNRAVSFISTYFKSLFRIRAFYFSLQYWRSPWTFRGRLQFGVEECSTPRRWRLYLSARHHRT